MSGGAATPCAQQGKLAMLTSSDVPSIIPLASCEERRTEPKLRLCANYLLPEYREI
jgi:hypothetical protein